MSEAHKGDIGTLIKIDLGEDISAATVLKIKYRKPSGTVGQWDAVIYGTTAVAFITTLITDLNEAGPWVLQAYVEIPTPWSGHSTVTAMEVLDVLVVP